MGILGIGETHWTFYAGLKKTLRLNPVDSILNILRYGANHYFSEFLPEKMTSELSEIRLIRVDPYFQGHIHQIVNGRANLLARLKA